MKFMSYNEKLAKIAVNKSLLKEYSNSSNERIVYIDDGTEFQIQIFNPYSYVIGVSFDFNNDINFSNQLLVLRPGERVWLERYLNNESKLLFSTYKVGASQEVKEAIKDNGNLQIKFFKEKEKNNYWYNNTIIVNKDDIYKPIDVYYNYTGLPTSYCNASFNCENTVNLSSLTANVSSSFDNSVATTASTYSYKTSTASTNIKLKNDLIETGRIEKGNHSNQRFTNVDKDFEYFPFKTEYIKILPTSQKQIRANDLKKIYCHECGRKLNTKYKFCPYCGSKLNT